MSFFASRPMSVSDDLRDSISRWENILLPVYFTVPGAIRSPFEKAVLKGAESALIRICGLKLHSVRAGSFNTPYYTAGDPASPPLVLLHGFSDSKISFALVARRLSAHYFVVMPDLPGFGDNSDIPDINPDLNIYTKWLRQFLKATGLTSASIGGNSLGGAVSLQYTVEQGKTGGSLPDKLILLNTAGVIGDRLSGFYEEIRRHENLFSFSDFDGFNRFLSRVFYHTPGMVLPVKAAKFSEMLARVPEYNRIMSGLTAPFMDRPVEEGLLDNDLSTVRVRTLVLWGDMDSLFPLPIGIFIQKHIPDARLKVLVSTGHVPQLERPAETASAIKNFLKVG